MFGLTTTLPSDEFTTVILEVPKPVIGWGVVSEQEQSGVHWVTVIISLTIELTSLSYPHSKACLNADKWEVANMYLLSSWFAKTSLTPL